MPFPCSSEISTTIRSGLCRPQLAQGIVFPGGFATDFQIRLVTDQLAQMALRINSWSSTTTIRVVRRREDVGDSTFFVLASRHNILSQVPSKSRACRRRFSAVTESVAPIKPARYRMIRKPLPFTVEGSAGNPIPSS